MYNEDVFGGKLYITLYCALSVYIYGCENWRVEKMELKLQNITKNYGEKVVLKDINVQLESGIYGLLGPNGAGKSTLIKLLTDNLKRQQGNILYDGTDILTLGKEYRNLLGYMPQQQGYYGDMPVGAFLMYMAGLKGIPRKKAKKRVDELLQVVSLTDVRYKPVGKLSGGMKQRVLLAQALLNDPKILILDEPTAGVDPQERIKIRNFISEIAEDKIILLATHIVSDVEAIAKEILLLKNGQLIRQEKPYDLLESVEPYVYEVACQKEQLKNLQNKYLISNIRHKEDGFLVKIIADEMPKEYECHEAEANLEDVYLYYFELKESCRTKK